MRRRGFTMVELIIALTLTMMVLAIAGPFFARGARAFESHSGRSDAQQNARFGALAVERELRMAGAGVVLTQPMVVQADPYAVSFSADLVSRVSSDIGAVNYDPDAPANEVSMLRRENAVVLPLSSLLYPDTNYTVAGGAPSSAETISFWVAPDTSRHAAGTWALYRRVNNGPAALLARGLIVASGEAAFRYFKTDTLARPVEIPRAQLPLFHSAKIHGSVADSGRAAVIDSIRSVRVRLVGNFRDRNGAAVQRVIEVGVRLMNAGLLQHSTCGESPLFARVVGVSTSGGGGSGNAPAVTLAWSPAADEGAGERDVERYAVYRRRASETDLGEPFASVSAGLPGYEFSDTDVQSGDQWLYAIAAQDCSGQLSELSQTSTVVVP